MLFIDQFRTHELRSTCHNHLLMISHHGQSQIDYFNLILWIYKNILWFQVPVRNFVLMQVNQSFCDWFCDTSENLLINWMVLFYKSCQWVVAETLHYDVYSFGCLVRINNFNYVGMRNVFQDFNLFGNGFLFFSGGHSKFFVRFNNTWQSISFPIGPSNFCKGSFANNLIQNVFLVIDCFAIFYRWKTHHFFTSNLFERFWRMLSWWLVLFQHFLLDVDVAFSLGESNIVKGPFSIIHYAEN